MGLAAGVEPTEAVIVAAAAAVAVVVGAAAAAVAVAVVAVLVLGPLEVPGVTTLPKKTSGEDGVGEVEVAEEHRTHEAQRRTHKAQHLPRRVQHQRLPIPTTMTTRIQTRTMLPNSNLASFSTHAYFSCFNDALHAIQGKLQSAAFFLSNFIPQHFQRQ